MKQAGYNVIGVAREHADIGIDLRHFRSCFDVVASARPDVVINAAAITDFAECKNDTALAYAVNGCAPGIMAEAASSIGVKFVQISTDHYYIDDGRRCHDEAAPVVLVNAYASSKYAGEVCALSVPDSLVVRTNVTGPVGLRGRQTFFNWALAVVERREKAILFNDYFTSTIGTGWFSRSLIRLIEADARGIVNIASREVSSKLEFVAALADALGAPLRNVSPVSVRSLAVRRAESLGLDVSKAESILGVALPTRAQVIDDLLREGRAL